ncbi:MAG: alpha-L-glutamate ligase-like protein [Gammaproteobacteria bacterium]|nr:alpha-L-glutamate ligase-like protein [Gammaproteobacteria bacterium]
MLARIRKLKAAGVIGIGSRNRGYIMPRNPRALYERVDDKVETKRLAMAAGIAVPELYGLIHSVREAHRFEQMVEGRRDFVVKPAHGSGGKGILVITDRRRDLYLKGDGLALTAREVEHHIQNVLGGVYSLGGQPDQAILEYRVKFDPVFEAVSYRGVPDIRVLVYRGVPAMAMLRLPTRASDGRANLHQGAVGVGIDLARGVTTLAVCKNHRIVEHPDFGTALAGLVIPGWDDLLLLAARCQELAPLGYLGVDMVLDAELGPLVLELNARPGLAIQIANGRGLRGTLDAIDASEPLPVDPAARAALAREVFLGQCRD